MTTRQEYEQAVSNCPTPMFHETHRYCPSCPWTEQGPLDGDDEPRAPQPNPMLENVNTNDPEDCPACVDLADWPCAYHEGEAAGVAAMCRLLRAVADDPAIVRVPRPQGKHAYINTVAEEQKP